MCAAGRRVLPEVTFHENDDCLRRRYDFILASNSVQYEEDWEGLLAKLANAATGWLLVTRLPITAHHPSFVVLHRVQAYGYGTETMGWVFNREELLHAAVRTGLEFEREFLLRPSWQIAGAPAEVIQAGFLFRAPRRT